MSVFCRVAIILFVLAGTVIFARGQTSAPATGPGALSCSPAPCVLPPTQGAPGGFDAPVAANPANPQDLILGSDYTGCPYPIASAFNLSDDGGTNWSDLVCMVPIFNNGTEYVPIGSPILGYDRNGTAYIGGFYLDDSGESQFGFEGFQKSSDGENWSAPAPVVIRRNSDSYYCWMAVDANASSPYVNSVYVSCVMSGPTTSPQVVVSHSNDGGTTWHQVNVAPAQSFPDTDLYTTMTVAKDGTVYLAWQYCNMDNACDNGTVYMVFSKSGDGGNTWSKPALVAPATLIYPLPNTKSVFVPDGPVIAVDASSGPHTGNLYVAMYNWTGTFMQLQVARSTDGGDTWSKPVPVSPGVTHDQFLPWISVSPTGLVGASWLDRRNDPKNTDYQAYAGISADGGLSFENVQLTSAFSDPNKGTETQGIGDYTGNTWDGPNYFVAAWLDNSESFYDEDYVGGIRLK
ncbi:MAG TPA: sialidase family protein [Terriglobales bacterium]|nr:sialidase family protein [Terriglobales bacterium]